MEVVAEIYQTDIKKIRNDQLAIVTGEAFDGKIQGTVHHVGLQVSQQKVFSNQPGENLARLAMRKLQAADPADVF